MTILGANSPPAAALCRAPDPPEAIVSLSDRFKRVVGVVGVEKGAEAVLELLESAAVRRGVTMSRDEVGADYGAGGILSLWSPH